MPGVVLHVQVKLEDPLQTADAKAMAFHTSAPTPARDRPTALNRIDLVPSSSMDEDLGEIPIAPLPHLDRLSATSTLPP
jgi:hypothetical protein